MLSDSRNIPGNSCKIKIRKLYEISSKEMIYSTFVADSWGQATQIATKVALIVVDAISFDEGRRRLGHNKDVCSDHRTDLHHWMKTTTVTRSSKQMKEM